jgi:hypothetical protein
MSILQYKNPISPIQVLNPFSVARNELFGTNFSVLGVGGFMEVYNLDDLQYTVPSGRTGTIEFSGNTIPIQFKKGSGSVFSPDVLTLNSDNISSGRRRLGMLVYVYETDKIYQFTIRNYDSLWSAATGATGAGGKSVVINTFGTVVKNNSVAGQNFINAWTGSTIEGVSGFTNANAAWRVLSFSGGSSNVSGDYLPLSGGTVTGNTIFQSGLTANTISATTYQNLPSQSGTGVSSFSYSPTTGVLTITKNDTNTLTAGTFSYVSATTLSSSNILSVTSNGGSPTTTTINAVTGGTYSNGTITLSGSGTILQSISGFPTTFVNDYLPLSGGTVTGNTIFNSGLTATTISATTYFNLPVTADTFVTGFTFNTSTYDLTIKQNNGKSDLTQSLSILASDLTVTGGTYDSNTGVATFTNNTGGTFQVSGFLTGFTDTLVTAFTYNNNTFTITDSRGSAFTASINTMTGLTATTISATTYQNLPVTADTFVTGFSLNNNIITLSQNRIDQYSGFSISLSAYTGGTSVSGNFLPLSGGTVTGNTIFQSGLTANTISATTYFNLPSSTFTGGTINGATNFTAGLSANTISATTYQNLPSQSGTGISAFSYSPTTGVLTITKNDTNTLTAGTFSYVSATTLSSSNVLSVSSNGGTPTTTTINAVTGGTYSNGTITLSGTGNFASSISGFPTTFTNDYLPLSGGTVTGNTIFNSGLTATTISATTYQNLPIDPDTYVTGFTLSSNTITLTQNRTDGYSSFTISLSAYTGSSSTTSGEYLPLSGGTVTGGTIFQSGITANTISQTQYIDFTTGTTNPSQTGGRMFFDNVSKALSYYDVDNTLVPIAMGQQLYTRVWNASGVQIDKGKVIAITGTSNNLPSAILARNVHTAGSDRPIGLAAENIPNGFEGLVLNNGILSGITLNTFSNGDTLYLSDTIPGGYVASTTALSFTARTNEIGYVLQTGDTTGKIYVSINNEDSNLTLTDKERNILEGNVISGGVYEYTGMTQGTGQTINVAYARGWIVKNTYEYATLPDVINIYYTGGTNIPLTYLNSADATYFLINSGSTLLQQATFPTPQQRRENIFLGKVVHPNRSTILAFNNTVDFDVSPMAAIRDIWTPIKLINQGVLPSFNTGLTINTSYGTLWGNGIGWTTNQLNPDSVTITAKTRASFFYRTQTGGTSSAVFDIDPTKYDVGGVITSVGTAGSNDATNQRIYMYPTGVINILYGQTRYTTLAAAVAAIDSESFVIYPNADTTGILIGIISVRNDIVADIEPLTNTAYAKLTLTSKFGESFGGTGGISTTTLQQAYNNSSFPAEIITNSILGALHIQNGAGADNVSKIFDAINSGGTSTAFMRADGLISGSSVSAPTISATTYYGVNAVTGGTYNGTTGVITLSGTGSVNGNQITGFTTGGGGGITWNSSNTTQSMTADNGYVTTAATLTTFTLPSTIAFGKTVEIAGNSSGLWRLNQNSGQQIRFGNQTTTTTSGILSATSQGDCVKLICVVADTSFIVTSSVGNIFFN